MADGRQESGHNCILGREMKKRKINEERKSENENEAKRTGLKNREGEYQSSNTWDEEQQEILRKRHD
jgi:hypothetical protein